MAITIRRAGRTTAEGAGVYSGEGRSRLSEPPMWTARGELAVPHDIAEAINEAAEAADDEPGREDAFRAALWEIHDAHEANEIEAAYGRTAREGFLRQHAHLWRRQPG